MSTSRSDIDGKLLQFSVGIDFSNEEESRFLDEIDTLHAFSCLLQDSTGEIKLESQYKKRCLDAVDLKTKELVEVISEFINNTKQEYKNV